MASDLFRSRLRLCGPLRLKVLTFIIALRRRVLMKPIPELQGLSEANGKDDKRVPG